MKLYVKHNIFEFAVCVLISLAISINVYSGFYIPQDLANDVIRALLFCFALQLLFYTAAYNKICTLILVPLMIICAVIGILIIRSQNVQIIDSESSDTVIYIYYFITIASSIIVFSLSRFRAGSVVLFVMGVAVIGCLSFLKFDTKIWAMILFVICVPVIYILRQYRYGLLHTSSTDADFKRCFISGLVLTMAAVFLSGAFYLCIIRPLDPPVMDIKLISKYLSLEILDQTGIYQKYSELDENLSSQEKGDMAFNTSQEGTEEDDQPEPESGSSTPEESESGEAGLNTGSGETEETVASASYGNQRLIMILAIILIIILLISVFPLKLLLRYRQKQKIVKKQFEGQIMDMYHFFVKKWNHLGIKHLQVETPNEYAQKNSDKLSDFNVDGGRVNITYLTEIFSRIKYGESPVNEEEYKDYLDFYNKFYANCKNHLGKFGYAKKFFWL